MAKRMTVDRMDVWVGSIKDSPGALAKKLAALSEAKANLKFVLARRTEKRGRGVVFLAPLKGAAQLRAAKKVGLRKSKSLRALRVQGPDRRGLGAKMTAALAEAGINLRGFSAAVVGREFVLNLALDSTADANKAARVLKAM